MYSLRGVLLEIGLPDSSTYYISLKAKLTEFEINYQSLFFKEKPKKSTIVRKLRSLEEIFIKGTRVDSTVREIILNNNLISYTCEGCGLGPEWQGEVMALHLDHKNGDRTDNHLSNLRFLCPNCHQITPTWGSKRLKKQKTSKILTGECLDRFLLSLNISSYDFSHHF